MPFNDDSAITDLPLLVRAALGQPTPRPPVWFMRQAGRSLPEYRAAREGIAMLDACAKPELVAEITSQPVRRYGVDAAILYSDIVVPLKWAGIDVDIVPGTGPVVASPVRTAQDVAAMPELTPEQAETIGQAVQATLSVLDGTPLIGFAGAPYTLASYLIEGGPSKNHERTKAMMWGAPEVFDALLAKLARITSVFLEAQIRAGASAVQLFDSWVGSLNRFDYVSRVQPHSAAVLSAVKALDVGREVPTIHFGVGTGELLPAMAEAGPDVVGVDYRLSLAEAARRVPGYALQGNLDPAVLFADHNVIADHTRSVIASGRTAPGHIFNLGHGVMPTTDPAALQVVVDTIKGSTWDGAGAGSA